MNFHPKKNYFKFIAYRTRSFDHELPREKIAKQAKTAEVFLVKNKAVPVNDGFLSQSFGKPSVRPLLPHIGVSDVMVQFS